jgi:hypothetical protein
MARTLADEDPREAARLLLDVADISQDRPADGLTDRYQMITRRVADHDIGHGRILADLLREWCPPPQQKAARRSHPAI